MTLVCVSCYVSKFFDSIPYDKDFRGQKECRHTKLSSDLASFWRSTKRCQYFHIINNAIATIQLLRFNYFSTAADGAQASHGLAECGLYAKQSGNERIHALIVTFMARHY
ncbi:hypothetical protein [Chamaesiphon sp. VAR_48_metabat_403]|uniref:hypothetical protein n=1 Tax=Chamaesiphon sp. VAR_48_metabat_403 TaxID=2964700 RepID=UPI00286E9E41|nr:hypothetical protein [Chamaesiphon sp. VAR_48_metabat_403]